VDAEGLETLLAVTLVAALAPIVVAVLPGPKIPQVVVLILAGILIGPHGLGLADSGSIQLFSDIGLGNQRAASRRRLHDNDMLGGNFGRYVIAAGAVGELFPIVAIALFLSRRDEFSAIASLLAVAAAALLLTVAPRVVGERRLQAVVRKGQRATAQTTLRLSIVLLLVLLVLAERFGLDVVLGALLAGMVLRSWTRRIDMDVERLEQKLDAVGYGVFIPLFFVCSGMTLDIRSIASDPVRLLVLAALLLVVRGLPALLVYARSLPFRQRAAVATVLRRTGSSRQQPPPEAVPVAAADDSSSPA